MVRFNSSRRHLAAVLAIAGATALAMTAPALAAADPSSTASCAKRSGDWMNGSCAGEAIAFPTGSGGDTGTDVLANLAQGLGSSTYGWSYVGAAVFPASGMDNAKWAYDAGASTLTLAVREEASPGTELPDDNARGLWRSLGPLARGSYKLSLEGSCAETTDGSEAAGIRCDGENGSAVAATPAFVRLYCDLPDSTWSSINNLFFASVSVPAYAARTRHEYELVVADDCDDVRIAVFAYQDSDPFESRVRSDASTERNGTQTTTELWRTVSVGALRIAPLAIDANETAVGLADYVALLDRVKDFADPTDLFDQDNPVYLTEEKVEDGASPILWRTQSGETRKNFEVRHPAAILEGATPSTKEAAGSPYFFASRRPDEMRAWTAPTEEMVEGWPTRSGDSIELPARQERTADQVPAGADRVRLTVGVRNPTDSAIPEPAFTLPEGWSIYSRVDLPQRLKSDNAKAYTSFTILPDHLSKCAGGAAATVATCGDWPIPPQSSRAYVIEVPPDQNGSFKVGLRDTAGTGEIDELAVSVAAVDPNVEAARAERHVQWGRNGYSSDAETLAATTRDEARRGVTDTLYYGSPTNKSSCSDGMAGTPDGTPGEGDGLCHATERSSEDLDGDGVKGAQIAYLPLTQRRGDLDADGTAESYCVADPRRTSATLSVDGLNETAAQERLRVGLVMSGPATWWLTPNTGLPLDGATVDSQPFAAGSGGDQAPTPQGEGSGVDLNGDKKADYNRVTFSWDGDPGTRSVDDDNGDGVTDGDDTDDASEARVARALVVNGEGAVTNGAPVIAMAGAYSADLNYARVARVADEHKSGTDDVNGDGDTNDYVIYADIPFDDPPKSATNATINKAYARGAIDGGIVYAQRYGKCADATPVTAARLAFAKNGSNTDAATGIVKYCGTSDEDGLEEDCKLDSAPTPEQRELIASIAAIYKTGLYETNGWCSASTKTGLCSTYARAPAWSCTTGSECTSEGDVVPPLVENASTADETNAWNRRPSGTEFFNGFGQDELLRINDVLERGGVRTTHTQRPAYAVADHEYVVAGGGARGTSFPALTGRAVGTSAYMTQLNEAYRDPTVAGSRLLTYTGGYDAAWYTERARAGLSLRRTVPWCDDAGGDGIVVQPSAGGACDDGPARQTAVAGSLLWAYSANDEADSRYDDPDYVDDDPAAGDGSDDDDYQSHGGDGGELARYVAARDRLDWGTDGWWALTTGSSPRYGMFLPRTTAGVTQNLLRDDADGEPTMDEVAATAALMEGHHDLGIARAEPVDLSGIPWGLAADGSLSTCTLQAVVDAHDPAGYCGNYVP